MRLLLTLTTIIGAVLAYVLLGVSMPWVLAGVAVFYIPPNRYLAVVENRKKTFLAMELLEKVEETEVITYNDLLIHCELGPLLLRKLAEKDLISVEREEEDVLSKTGDVLMTRHRTSVCITIIGHRWLKKERAKS